MVSDPSSCWSEPIDLPRQRLAGIIGRWQDPAFLEGDPRFGPAGRWSLFTAEPRLVFESDSRAWVRRSAEASWQFGASDPLEALADLLSDYRCAQPADFRPAPELPPFQGGFLGHISYDLAPKLERLPRRTPVDSRVPVLRFGLYDWCAAIDHSTGRSALWAFDLIGDGPSATQARARDLVRRLDQRAYAPSPTRLEGPPASNFTRSEYLDAVSRALEYIAAGDIFQVNLSQRFEARGRIEPLDLYLRLRHYSPAPYSAYLAWDNLAVVSASPELFYVTRGDRIATRPIKGTRPRGSTAEEDARLAAELKNSAKDRAELTMIVDLERNDLGRVCRYGTVRVTEPLVAESYAQVHHLVATVAGRLRPEMGPVDVVRAVFPGGSITGAPKIRAMEIIDELEPCRRGLYTGAIGYFGRGGVSAFNIVIRTLIAEGDRVTYQVGGGIVADSSPEGEFDETLHKGRGLREVLDGRGLGS